MLGRQINARSSFVGAFVVMLGLIRDVKLPVVLVLATSGGTRSAGEIVLDVKQTRMSKNFARRRAVGFRPCLNKC